MSGYSSPPKSRFGTACRPRSATRINLVLLFIAVLLDWLPAGVEAVSQAKPGLATLIFALSELHARIYALRLAHATRAQYRGALEVAA